MISHKTFEIMFPWMKKCWREMWLSQCFSIFFLLCLLGKFFDISSPDHPLPVKLLYNPYIVSVCVLWPFGDPQTIVTAHVSSSPGRTHVFSVGPPGGMDFKLYPIIHLILKLWLSSLLIRQLWDTEVGRERSITLPICMCLGRIIRL